MILRHVIDVEVAALADPLHPDADVGTVRGELDLSDVLLQPVVELVQAHGSLAAAVAQLGDTSPGLLLVTGAGAAGLLALLSGHAATAAAGEGCTCHVKDGYTIVLNYCLPVAPATLLLVV